MVNSKLLYHRNFLSDNRIAHPTEECKRDFVNGRKGFPETRKPLRKRKSALLDFHSPPEGVLQLRLGIEKVLEVFGIGILLAFYDYPDAFL